MTKDEILIKLETVGIIVKIKDDYILTEKYKTILTEIKTQPIVQTSTLQLKPIDDYSKILNTNTNGTDWPAEILEQRGRERVQAIMDACKIPITASKGYRLRGIDKDAVNIIGNIVDDPNIDGSTFIEAIRLYYRYTTMPKGFKNLIKDGDVLDIYNEHVAGTLVKGLSSTNKPDSQVWR